MVVRLLVGIDRSEGSRVEPRWVVGEEVTRSETLRPAAVWQSSSDAGGTEASSKRNGSPTP